MPFIWLQHTVSQTWYRFVHALIIIAEFAYDFQALARAVPDPNVAYRKSQRSQAAADELARVRTTPPPAETGPDVPSLTAARVSPAPKRQRRQSPQPGAVNLNANAATSPSNDESRHLTLEATTTVTSPAGAHVDMEAEIQSAKQLVLDLKRELRLRAAAGEDLEDQGFDVSGESRGVKRVQGEDEAVVISGGAGKDRIVRRSRRVEANVLGNTAKRVAWCAVIFGLGVGAAS